MRRRSRALRERFVPRSLAALVLASAWFAALPGCGGGSSGSSEEARLVVENFNHHLLPGVLLNSPLVFTFSTSVDPASVNSNTIQIWTTVQRQRMDALGVFQVNGRIVVWYPQMTSKVYPLKPANNTDPIMPTDAGLNTAATNHFSYNVLVPSAPSPNTVKSSTGKPVREAFTSTFETAQGPAINTPGNSAPLRSIFDNKAPFFRNSIRVADAIAYSGSTSPARDYLGWLNNPGSTNGENPLFQDPAMLDRAKSQWTGRDRTGELVDQDLRIQLVPALTAKQMPQNVFPPNRGRDDERLVSNLQGVQQGRPKAVEAINVYFTQPLPADTFLDKQNNPKLPAQSPLSVHVLPTATAQPTPQNAVSFTATFNNDTDRQAALLNIALDSPVSQGFVHFSFLVNAVFGMPGGNLEPNLGSDFNYIWPVRINAR